MTLSLAVTLVTALWATYGGTLDLASIDEIEFHCPHGPLITHLGDGSMSRHIAWYADAPDGQRFVQIAMTIDDGEPAA